MNRISSVTLLLRTYVVIIASIGLFTSVCFAQFADAPPGDATNQTFDVVPYYSANPYSGITCTYSAKSLRINPLNYNTYSSPSPLMSWEPPPGVDIVKASMKVKDERHMFVLLSDGSIYGITINSVSAVVDGPTHLGDADALHGSQNFSDIVGDAVYALSNHAIYISRDSARTWQRDTAGIGSGSYYQIAMDTNQFVYAAHLNGLYKQHPDSNLWRKVTTFPKPNSLVAAVFVDRRNRVFARSSGNIYLSTDNGSTWNLDTAGIGSNNISRFCDDKFGNAYATDGHLLWRSMGGTQPWVRIDQPIQSYVYDPSAFLYKNLFNRISGDSLVYAATALGVFFSSNQGSTWIPDSAMAPAKFMYGFIKTASGKFLTSTNLGVYTKNPPDSVWKKTFPLNGFLSGSPIFTDGSGNAFTLGKRINGSDNLSMFSNWKSTDDGQTWNPDTTGLGAIGRGQNQIYSVDETGVQYFGAYDTPAPLYSKKAGQSWAPDTAGFGQGSSIYPFAFVIDRKGFVYVSIQNKTTYTSSFWKRPVTGGAWILDTNGLNGASIYALAADKSGNLIAGTYTGVYRNVGGTWSQIPYPSGLGGNNAFVVSVDSTGAIIAGFSSFVGFTALWHGVYATKDNGAHWTYLGLDSISVRGLVSYGDTTYAYTYANGIYRMRSASGGTLVNSSEIVRNYSLDQNYPNPFNPATTIRYSLAAASSVTMKIYNVLGQEVRTLFNGEQHSGIQQLQWDGKSQNGLTVSSGIYFYRIVAEEKNNGSIYSAVRRMVLLK